MDRRSIGILLVGVSFHCRREWCFIYRSVVKLIEYCFTDRNGILTIEHGVVVKLIMLMGCG